MVPWCWYLIWPTRSTRWYGFEFLGFPEEWRPQGTGDLRATLRDPGAGLWRLFGQHVHESRAWDVGPAMMCNDVQWCAMTCPPFPGDFCLLPYAIDFDWTCASFSSFWQAASAKAASGTAAVMVSDAWWLWTTISDCHVMVHDGCRGKARIGGRNQKPEKLKRWIKYHERWAEEQD